MSEGYIKFQCDWIKKSSVISESDLSILNNCRDRLYAENLVGAYADGIGFGNLSVRVENTQEFIITGTQTGKYSKLTSQQYTRVCDYDISSNQLTCLGPIKASSESLSHAAIYQAYESIKAVIHVHNLAFWKTYLDKLPTTSQKAEFGTPAMAQDILHLFKSTKVLKTKCLIMGGHPEGIISWGENLAEASEVLFKYYERLKK